MKLAALWALSIAGAGSASSDPFTASGSDNFNYSALGDLVLGGAFNAISTPHAGLTDADLDQFGTEQQFVSTVFNSSTENSILNKPSNDSSLLVNANGRIYSSPFTDGEIVDSCFINGGSNLILLGNFSTVFNTSVTGGLVSISTNSTNSTNSSDSGIEVKSIANGNISAPNINALACVNNTVFVGGNFTLNGASGVAVSQLSNLGVWSLPSFGAFFLNGVVNTIANNNSESLLFGGSFVYPSINTSFNASAYLEPGSQTVSLRYANATAYNSNTSDSEDASNLLCPNSGGWTAAENSVQAFVDIGLAHVSYLTKIRIYNSLENPTKTFRIQSYPPGGIMNLTYTDDDGDTQSCTAECPLSRSDAEYEYTEFTFVNVIPAAQLRISLLDFYDSKSGLDGIMLFEQDQNIYANNDFNLLRTCSAEDMGVNGIQTGFSSTSGSFQSLGDYIYANISDKQTFDDYSIRFEPVMSAFTTDTAKYQILVYTPGCLESSSCAARGAVNVTVYPGFGTPQSTVLWQTNDYLKFDTVYTGTISSNTYILIEPASTNQAPLEFVGYRVGLIRSDNTDPTFSTHNVFEYSLDDHAEVEKVQKLAVNMKLVQQSPLNSLNLSSSVNDVLMVNRSVYIAADDYVYFGAGSKYVQINGIPKLLKFYNSLGSVFAVSDSETYSVSGTKFTPLGIGYSKSITDLSLDNVSYAAMFLGDSSSTDVALWTGTEFADAASQRLKGHARSVPDFYPNANLNLNSSSNLLLGSLQLVDSLLNGGAAILSATNSSTTIHSLAFNTWSNSSLDVYDGIYLNETHGLLVGDFVNVETTNDSAVVRNAALFSSNSSAALPVANNAISNDSVIIAVAVANNSIAALGGNIDGKLNDQQIDGLIIYNYTSSDPFSSQPSVSSTGSNNITTLAFRPNTSVLVAGGQFSSPECSALCLYDTDSSSWLNSTMFGLNSSSQVTDLVFVTQDTLAMGGDLFFNDTNAQFAVYNFTNSSMQLFPSLPGVVTSIAVSFSADSEIYTVSGTDPSSGMQFVQQLNTDSNSWSELDNMPALLQNSVISRLSLISANNMADPVLTISGNLVLSSGTASMITYDGQNWGVLYIASSEEASSDQTMLRAVFAQKKNDLKGGVNELQPPTTTTASPSSSSSSSSSPSSSASSTSTSTSTATQTGSGKYGDRKLMPRGHVVGVACGIGVGCVLLLSTLYLFLEHLMHMLDQHKYQTLNHEKVISSDSLQDTSVVK